MARGGYVTGSFIPLVIAVRFIALVITVRLVALVTGDRYALHSASSC